MMEVGVMPKEQVVGDASSPFEATVGWSPDTVQVGVQTVDGRSIVTMLYGGTPQLQRIAQQVCAKLGVTGPQGSDSEDEAEAQARLGRELLDIIEANGDGHLSYTGLFATLGRVSVNDLIRLLRRARDRAFGKDE